MILTDKNVDNKKDLAGFVGGVVRPVRPPCYGPGANEFHTFGQEPERQQPSLA